MPEAILPSASTRTAEAVPVTPRALEARVKTKGPRLVLVSTGTVEANRASGFRSPVLLDQSFAGAAPRSRRFSSRRAKRGRS